jgi:DNA replication ATP-dependent helicase Dna2
MGSLIQRLNQAIDNEYDWKNQEVRETLKIPVEERVKKGDTIVDVYAEFIALDLSNQPNDIGFFKVKVACKDNKSKFRETTPIILSGHGHSFELDVLEDNDNEMLLGVGWGSGIIPRTLNNKDGWQIDTAAVDIRHIVKKSTSILSQSVGKLEYLNGIFEGEILPDISRDRKKMGAELALKTDLNPTQKEAFANAYAANNFYLIQGPPGSGKTWLLAHLAHQFALEGKNVLITAFTHTAINNALQKTSTLTQYPHIIKVGKNNQKEGLNYEGSTALNIPDLSRSIYDEDSKGIIVGATCYSPHTRKMEFMNWDIIIFDEAGQLSIPLAFAAMVKGKKFIFIGDHRQLPPIIAENQTDDVFKKSIFEHLHQFDQGIMLDTTYRMNKQINAFPSKQFYDGKLVPHKNNENWLLEIPNEFDKHSEVLDINKPEVLFCHYHESIESRSEYEANVIAEFVDEYLKQGVSPDDIAVLTPFRAQVRQIKKALAKLNNYNEFKESLFIDTVERIQGQERDIVIFSLATTDPVKAMQRVTFFFNPNRFNVAITRSKKKRIVIGNKNLFHLSSKDQKIDEMIENFRDFYNDSFKVFEQAETEDLF